MVDRHKLGSSAKKRGNSLEREVADYLAEWSGKTFKRTPASGAWSSAEQFGVNADVISTWPDWHYIVECKYYNSDWTLENLFSNNTHFPVWVAQAVREGQESDAPFMLVFRRNYIKPFLLLPYTAKATKVSQYMVTNVTYLSEVTGAKESIKTITMPLVTFMNEVSATDFIKWYASADWQKRIKKQKVKKPTKADVNDVLSALDDLDL